MFSPSTDSEGAGTEGQVVFEEADPTRSAVGTESVSEDNLRRADKYEPNSFQRRGTPSVTTASSLG